MNRHVNAIAGRLSLRPPLSVCNVRASADRAAPEAGKRFGGGGEG